MASYSASLLEAWNPNLSAYSTSIPFEEARIKPAPLPWALVAPSIDILQMGRSDASWAVSRGSAEVNSMMKFAKIFPLIVVLGLYLMSNSLNSMAISLVFQRFLVCAIFASWGVMLEFR